MVSKPTILIVDSEELIAQDIKNTLERAGYSTPLIISEREEVAQSVRKLQPDLVLMYIHLNGYLGGIATAKEIIQTQNIPVIYLIDNDDEETVRQAKATSPYGYLLNPFNEFDLRILIEVAIHKHATEKARQLGMEQNPAAVVVHKDGIVLYANSACAKMMKFDDPKVLIGQPVMKFVTPEFRDFVASTFSDKYVFDYEPTEQRIYDALGEPIEILATGARIQYQGKTAIQSVFLNITQSSRLAEELKQSREQYRILVQNASLGIVSCDGDGNIIEANPALLEILGSPSLEATRSINLFTYPPIVEAGISQQLKLSLHSKESIIYETSYTSKWRKKTYLRMHISPSVKEDTHAKTVQMLVEDFTEFNRAINNLQVSEENFRKIYDQAGDPIIIMDFKGNILDTNRTARDVFGYTQEEFKELDIQAISAVLIDVTEKVNILRNGKTHRFETIHKRKNGEQFPVEVSCNFITYNGELVILNVGRDITERKLAEELAEQHKTELRTLMQISQEVTKLSGFEETLRAILQNAVKHLHASAGSLMINSPQMPITFVHEGLPDNLVGEINTHCPIITKVKWHQCIIQQEISMQLIRDRHDFDHCLHLNNSDYNILLSATLDDNNATLGYVHLYRKLHDAFTSDELQFLNTLLQQSITAIKKAHLFEETQRLATIDPLTELYNRRHLYLLGKHELDRAKRYKNPLSAIMIDADKFKNINDTYGHAMGDQILQELARHLRNNMRDVDIIGRYGGEEFAIILPNTDLESAAELAERIRASIDSQITVTRRKKHARFTISLGVAMMGQDTPTLEALLDKADRALYRAKEAGRNQVMVES